MALVLFGWAGTHTTPATTVGDIVERCMLTRPGAEPTSLLANLQGAPEAWLARDVTTNLPDPAWATADWESLLRISTPTVRMTGELKFGGRRRVDVPEVPLGGEHWARGAVVACMAAMTCLDPDKVMLGRVEVTSSDAGDRPGWAVSCGRSRKSLVLLVEPLADPGDAVDSPG